MATFGHYREGKVHGDAPTGTQTERGTTVKTVARSILISLLLGLAGLTLADVDDGGIPDVGFAPTSMLADVDDGGIPDVG